MRSKEDVISIIRSYCLANDGDEATTDLLLAVGAEILGVSAEEMQKRLAWSDRESDVPNQEDGHEQDRFTKRLPDGQATPLLRAACTKATIPIPAVGRSSVWE